MATPIDDDTLQRFYDGDLSPLEEHSLSARIEGDVDAQRRLAQLSKLSELLRDNAHELAKGVDSAALFGAIEAKLADATQPSFGSRLRVISSEWLDHKRTAVVPIVAATAVAAAVLLMVVRGNAPQVSESSDSTAQIGAEIHGSRVENVDFGTNTGTVFEIEDRGVAVAVVWIAEDEESP
jgi:anti-sigma factor RsiW